MVDSNQIMLCSLELIWCRLLISMLSSIYTNPQLCDISGLKHSTSQIEGGAPGVEIKIIEWGGNFL